jgi:hypothetical protein
MLRRSGSRRCGWVAVRTWIPPLNTRFAFDAFRSSCLSAEGTLAPSCIAAAMAKTVVADGAAGGRLWGFSWWRVRRACGLSWRTRWCGRLACSANRRPASATAGHEPCKESPVGRADGRLKDIGEEVVARSRPSCTFATGAKRAAIYRLGSVARRLPAEACGLLHR